MLYYLHMLYSIKYSGHGLVPISLQAFSWWDGGKMGKRGI